MNVLLLEPKRERRDLLAAALRNAGIIVTPVQSIAEVERWPQGDVVVTRSQWFTPFWALVGATGVIVLADGAAQDHGPHAQGAHAWMPADCSADALVCALLTLYATHPASRRFDARQDASLVDDQLR